MNSDLKMLEEEVSRLVTLYQEICNENILLRQQLAQTSAHNEKLTEKINLTSSRLENLLKHLPDYEQ
jgi:archaellum component FlaC